MLILGCGRAHDQLLWFAFASGRPKLSEVNPSLVRKGDATIGSVLLKNPPQIVQHRLMLRMFGPGT